jgi:hypothetical protein
VVATDLREQLALLTDKEAEASLRGVLKNQVIQEPIYQDIFNNPEKMKQIVKTVSDDANVALPNFDNLSYEETPKVIRVSLLQIAEDEELRPVLEGWLRNNLGRDTLVVEPVSAAVAMAGIVMVLTTKFSVRYKDETTQNKSLDVSVSHSPATEGFLENFFRLIPTFSGREDTSEEAPKPPST